MSELSLVLYLQGHLEVVAPIVMKNMLSRNLHSVLNAVTYFHDCIGGCTFSRGSVEDNCGNDVIADLIHKLLIVSETSKV